MKVSDAKVPRKPEFDPSLGALCAETWWDFGKLLANINNDEWLKKTLSKIHKDVHPDYRQYITLESLRDFVATAFNMLRRFYEGESIKNEISQLIYVGDKNDYVVTESGKFIEVNESPGVFWAIEYKALFECLSKPWDTVEDHPDGWLNAVALCEQCGTFFVKQRKDQIFDTARCRTKFANRDTYLSRRVSRRRGHRG